MYNWNQNQKALNLYYFESKIYNVNLDFEILQFPIIVQENVMFGIVSFNYAHPGKSLNYFARVGVGLV